MIKTIALRTILGNFLIIYIYIYIYLRHLEKKLFMEKCIIKRTCWCHSRGSNPTPSAGETDGSMAMSYQDNLSESGSSQ